MRLVQAHADGDDESSIHLHEHQDNIFIVRSGLLRVMIYGALEDYCNLGQGMMPLLVPAGIKHKFVALSDVEMYEQYIGVHGHSPVESDIVRFTEQAAIVGS